MAFLDQHHRSTDQEYNRSNHFDSFLLCCSCRFHLNIAHPLRFQWHRNFPQDTLGNQGGQLHSDSNILPDTRRKVWSNRTPDKTFPRCSLCIHLLTGALSGCCMFPEGISWAPLCLAGKNDLKSKYKVIRHENLLIFRKPIFTSILVYRY